MKTLLLPQQSILTKFSQLDCTIIELIGEGAQGEVYRAQGAGQDFAIKWYYPDYLRDDTGLEERLTVAIHGGAPGDAAEKKSFLWPFDLVSEQGNSRFGGYIMPIKEPHFTVLAGILNGKVNPSCRVLATIGLNLAHLFLQLHVTRGLCYRDINDRNIFFDPKSGEIRIADNDNVDIEGRPCGVLGTPLRREIQILALDADGEIDMGVVRQTRPVNADLIDVGIRERALESDRVLAAVLLYRDVGRGIDSHGFGRAAARHRLTERESAWAVDSQDMAQRRKREASGGQCRVALSRSQQARRHLRRRIA